MSADYGSPVDPQIIVRAGQDLAPDTVLDDRFRIVGKLGQGGMCVVYKAEHLQLHKPVAIKVLQPRLAVDKDAIERFRREAMAAAKLKHPNIVEVFGFGIWDDKPFMAMEFLGGKSLSDVLREQPHRRLEPERAVPIFAQICDALEQAHGAGIVHRDLKPSNVIVQDDDTVKLVDFGIARIVYGVGDMGKTLTRTGQIIGSLHYMSPEQLNGRPCESTADIYSMGCLMYETITGRTPFNASAAFQLMAKQLTEQPRRTQKLQNGLGTVILRCLNKHASERPQSAPELKQLILQPPHYTRERNSRVPAVIAMMLAPILLAGGVWLGVEELDRRHVVKLVRESQQAGPARSLKIAEQAVTDARMPVNQRLARANRATLRYGRKVQVEEALVDANELLIQLGDADKRSEPDMASTYALVLRVLCNDGVLKAQKKEAVQEWQKLAPLTPKYVEVAKLNSDRFEAYVFHGGYLNHTGQFDKAIPTLQEACRLAEEFNVGFDGKLSTKFDLMSAYVKAAMNNVRRKEYGARAVVLAREILATDGVEKSPVIVDLTTQSLAKALYCAGEFKTSIEMLKRLYNSKNATYSGRGSHRDLIVGSYRALHDYRQAVEFAKQHMADWGSGDNPNAVAEQHIGLATDYLKLGMTREAIDALKQAESLAQEKKLFTSIQATRQVIQDATKDAR